MAITDVSRRRLLQLSGGGLMTGALGLAGRPAFAQDVTLKVWDQYSSEPLVGAFQKVLDNFAAKTGYAIDRNVQLGGQIADIAATALSSGTGPDVLQYSVGQGNAGLLAEAGLIVPLEEYAEQYNWREKLSAIALAEASLDGQLWGAPQETEVSLFFVNRSLFEENGWEVPTTHEEMVALARAASEKGIIPIAYGEQDFYPSWWALSHVASNAMGAGPLTDLVFRNEGSFNTPEMVDGIEKYWVELREAGAFIPAVNALAASDAQALFQAGRALMLMSGTWSVGAIEASMPDTKLDIMPMWAINEKPRAYPTGSGSAFYIAADSDVKDECAELFDFCFELEQAKIMIEEASLIAPTPIDPSQFDLTEFQKRSVESVATGDGSPEENQGVFVNHGLAGSNFKRVMTNGFQAMMAGDKSAADQAADLQDAFEQDNA